MKRNLVWLMLVLLLTGCSASPTRASAPPSALAEYPTAVASFLNAAPENVWQLKDLLVEWGAMEPRAAVFAGDVSGTGRMDLFAPIYRKVEGRGPNDKEAAILRAYRPAGGPWQAELADRPESESVIDIQLHHVGDLTSDGQDEVYWSSAVFGANTGTQRVKGMALTKDGGWRPVFSEEQFWGDVGVNLSGDSPVLILQPGFAGSAGSGPQRSVTRQLFWRDGAFVVARQVLGANRYMPQRFVDAEWHLLAGREADAAAKYTEVLTDQSLLVWPEEKAEYRQFYRSLAAFRQMAMAAGRGDFKAVNALAEQALAIGYKPMQPVITAFRDQIKQNQNYRQACTAAAGHWPGKPDLPPYYWGFVNPPFTAMALCPDLSGYTLVPGGTPDLARRTEIP